MIVDYLSRPTPTRITPWDGNRKSGISLKKRGRYVDSYGWTDDVLQEKERKRKRPKVIQYCYVGTVVMESGEVFSFSSTREFSEIVGGNPHGTRLLNGLCNRPELRKKYKVQSVEYKAVPR